MSLFSRTKVKLLIFPLTIVAAAMVLNGNLKRIEDELVMDQAPWALPVSMAVKGTVSSGFPALGLVKSASEVRITPQISGRIVELGPRAGGGVNKGDLLVHLDTRELEANRNALKSKLASAEAVAEHDERELQREKELLEEGGSAASAVEQWQTKVLTDRANVRSLKEQIRQIEVKISYGHIRAPITATISQRPVEIGDTAMPGKVVYILNARRGGRVVVPVPLQTLTRLQASTEVELRQGDKNMLVRITRVNPALDRQSMGSLEIDLPARPFGLPDGARIPARVLTRKINNAVIVPRNALLPADDEHRRTLFRVVQTGDRHVLRKTEVFVPLCGKEGCAVEGEIQAGTQVVTGHGSVLLKLRDGDTVLVRDPAGQQREDPEASTSGMHP